jgi:ribosome maturation factor RimP
VKWNDEEIRAGIEHCLDDAEDLFLVDARLNALRGGFQLIVKCDSDSGITIDQLARINRSIHKKLDLPGLDIEKVSVEVSSPGSGFPVTTARHFRRHIGHNMNIEHNSDSADNPLTGEIMDANEKTLSIKVNDEIVSLDMAEIVQGKVIMRW